jgi:hypothetical protein
LSQFVFLLEEPSMKALLDGFLPTVIPASIEVVTIPHEGKSDLEKSIPRKLRAWTRPDARFFILRDQDSAPDCTKVKRQLRTLVSPSGREGVCIRIVCRELESWILGDAKALAETFDNPALHGLAVKASFRNPDTIGSPSKELKQLVPHYQKISGARAMGPKLSADRSASPSFKIFVSAVTTAVDDVRSKMAESKGELPTRP